MHRRFAPLLIATALLAGCATRNGKFPSLAPRPIEQTSDVAPERPAPVAAPDAALDGQLSTLSQRLADAAMAFDPAARQTRDLVAAAHSSGIGSDPWLDAQTALAALDGIRAESTAAMSALDELAIDRARRLEPAYRALDALHDKGEEQVAAESATIADLQRQLPGN